MPFLCPKLSERRHRCDSDIGGHKLCLPLEGSRISRPIRTTPSAALSPPSFDWWSNHRRALVFTFALRRSPHYPAVSGGRRIAGRFLFSEFRHYRPTGPRFSKRGDRWPVRDVAATVDGFNGAALFQARRYVGQHCACWPYKTGFNGAALFQARRCVSSTGSSSHFGQLQRGRAFPSAEIWDCAAERERIAMLQRGRAFPSAEMPACA